MRLDTSINLTCTWVKQKAQKNISDQVFYIKWLNPFKLVTLWFFDCFFNSPLLIVNLHERGLYGIGNAQNYKKRMPEIPVDKKMKRVDSE